MTNSVVSWKRPNMYEKALPSNLESTIPFYPDHHHAPNTIPTNSTNRSFTNVAVIASGANSSPVSSCCQQVSLFSIVPFTLRLLTPVLSRFVAAPQRDNLARQTTDLLDSIIYSIGAADTKSDFSALLGLCPCCIPLTAICE